MALALSDPRLHVLVEPYVVELLALPSGKSCPSKVIELANSQQHDFFSFTITQHEISILADEKAAKAILASLPGEHLSERSSWKALKISGPLDLSMVGVMHHFTRPLAEAKVSIFTLSTFLTDYILVKTDAYDDAVKALRKAGWSVLQGSSYG